MNSSPNHSAEARPDPLLRILVAEDVAVNQRLIVIMLRRLGLTADVVSDGLQAVEAIRMRAYDLVLMDIQMPVLDGLAATRQIHAEWPAGQRPRIVALTANAMPDDRVLCLEAGMDGFLSKPMDLAALSALLIDCPRMDRP